MKWRRTLLRLSTDNYQFSKKDGKFLTQSNAILRLLGREYGYYPTDIEDAYRVDNLLDLMGDFYTAILKVHFTKDEEEKKRGHEDQLINHYPKFFGFWDKKLTENSSQDFLVGDSATIVDFTYLSVISELLNNKQERENMLGILDRFPTLKAYFQTRRDAQAAYFESTSKSTS